jgi:hypothetical protein
MISASLMPRRQAMAAIALSVSSLTKKGHSLHPVFRGTPDA